MESRRQGIGVSPGIAIGPSVVVQSERPVVPEYEIHDADTELERLDAAVTRVREDLTSLHHRTLTELGEPDAAIIHAHLMLLDDVEIRNTLAERIRRDAMNAEHVVAVLVQENAATLKEQSDPQMRERAEDIEDVGDRVLRALLDLKHVDLAQIRTPSIVVASNLKPTDTARLDPTQVLGLVMDSGSTTAHSAILARALGIPTVMGLRDFCTTVDQNTVIIVDGNTGEVIYDPDQSTLARRRADQENWKREQLNASEEDVDSAATTTDGIEIALEANLTSAGEAKEAVAAGAAGVGLFRTEFMFLSSDQMPGEEEQFGAYREVASTFSPAPVTLRTIDLGGDKLTDSLAALEEDNPQLGWRAIRFSLARPDVFKTQLRAMLRASAFGKVRILFPMISSVDEFKQARAVVEAVKMDLSSEGLAYDSEVTIGAMIEVPSAVIVAERLAPECDFFSIGTNDLIQYTLAVDRGNEKVAHLYEPLSPAVLRMIKMTADAANRAGIPCEICGAMAGEAEFTELLVGLGVRGLSMPSILLSGIRRRIRAFSLSEARTLAEAALEKDSATEVWALLNEHNSLVAHAVR